jgi:hypothetical protein
VVAASVETYREERQKLSTRRRKRQGELTRDLGVVKRKINAMLEIIMAGNADAKSIGRKLVELEADQERLETELAQAPDTEIAIHPTAAERYRAKVAEIHDALTKGESAAREAIQLLRCLIDHIVVTPTARPAPVGLQVVGNLAALLVCVPPGAGTAESMVAGARNSYYSIGQAYGSLFKFSIQIGRFRPASDFHSVARQDNYKIASRLRRRSAGLIVTLGWFTPPDNWPGSRRIEQ